MNGTRTMIRTDHNARRITADAAMARAIDALADATNAGDSNARLGPARALVLDAASHIVRASTTRRKSMSLSSVIARDGLTCHLCGDVCTPTADGGNLPTCATLDHIVPVSLGGYDDYDNAMVAHRSCNSDKGNAVASSMNHARLDRALKLSPGYTGPITYIGKA